MKVRYIRGKEHVITFPLPAPTVTTGKGVLDFHGAPPPAKDEKGNSVLQSVKVRFDKKGLGEVTKEEWAAIEPYAAAQGIVKA